jgi:hypothetical protein
MSLYLNLSLLSITGVYAVLRGIASSVGTTDLRRGLNRTIPKRLRAGRAGRPSACLDGAFVAVIATSALDTLLAFELVRERILMRNAYKAGEHDSKERTESGKARTYNTTVKLNDGLTGGYDASPGDIFRLSAFVKAKDACNRDNTGITPTRR